VRDCVKHLKAAIQKDDAHWDDYKGLLGWVRNTILMKRGFHPCDIECTEALYVEPVFSTNYITKAVAKQGAELKPQYDFNAQAKSLREGIKARSLSTTRTAAVLMFARQRAAGLRAAAEIEALGLWAKKTQGDFGMDSSFMKVQANAKVRSQKKGLGEGKVEDMAAYKDSSAFDIVFSQQAVWPTLGLGKYPRFKGIGEFLNSVARTITYRRYEAVRGKAKSTPVCVMDISYYIAFCTTCRCSKGLVQANIATKLVKATPKHNCKMWFGMNDAIARTILGTGKAFDTVGHFRYVANKGKGCFGLKQKKVEKKVKKKCNCATIKSHEDKRCDDDVCGNECPDACAPYK